MKINYRDQNNNNFSVTIDLPVDSTVKELKAKIFKQTNIPTSHQLIFYDAHYLEDESLQLNTYNVAQDSTISMMFMGVIENNKVQKLEKISTNHNLFMNSLINSHLNETTSHLAKSSFKISGKPILMKGYEHKDQKRIIIACEEGDIYSFDPRNPENNFERTEKIASSGILALSSNKDQDILIGSKNGQIIKIDFLALKQIDSWKLSINSSILAIEFEKNLEHFYIGTSSSMCERYRLESKGNLKKVHSIQRSNNITSINAESNPLLVGYENGAIECFHFPNEGQDPEIINLNFKHSAAIKFLVWTNKGATFLSCCSQNVLVNHTYHETLQSSQIITTKNKSNVTAISAGHSDEILQEHTIIGYQSGEVELSQQEKIGNLIVQLPNFDAIKSIHYDSASKSLYSASESGLISISNFSNTRETHVLPLKNVNPGAITFTPKYCILGTDSSIFLYENYLSANPDIFEIKDVHTVCSSEDNSLSVISLLKKSIHHIFKFKAASDIISFDIHSDNSGIILISKDNSAQHLYALDILQHKEFYHILFREEQDLIGVEYTKQANRFNIMWDGHITLYEWETGRKVATNAFVTLDIHYKLAKKTPDFKTIVMLDAAQETRWIKILDAERVETVYRREIIPPKTHIENFVITPDSSYLIAKASDNTIRIIDIWDKREIFCYSEFSKSSPILAYNVSTDSEYIAVVFKDRVVLIRNAVGYGPMEVMAQSKSGFLLLRDFVDFININRKIVFNEGSVEFKQKKKFIFKNPDFVLLPHHMNLLHIAAIFMPQKEVFKACFEAGTKISVDKYGWTPLHYLLSLPNLDKSIIDYYIEFMTDYPEIAFHIPSIDKRRVFESMFQEFPQIVEKVKPELLINLLENVIYKPRTFNYESSAGTGSLKNGDEINIVTHDSDILERAVREKLVRDKGNDFYSIKTIIAKMDYRFESDDMLELCKNLYVTEENDVFKTRAIRYIIKMNWDISSTYYTFLAIFYSLMMIFLSILMAFNEYNMVPLEISLFTLAVLFIIYDILLSFTPEIISFTRGKWHIAFVFGHIALACVALSDWLGIEYDIQAWIRAVALFFGFAKWITYFRFFDQTSKNLFFVLFLGRLILLIANVLVDMRGIAMVMFFAILGGSVIFHRFERDTSFKTHLLETYSAMFGSFETENYNSNQIIFFIPTIFLLTIVTLNKLTVIMANTFTKVQDNMNMTDSLAKLSIILETMAIKRPFVSIGRKWTGQTKNENKKYLFIAETTHSEAQYAKGWEGQTEAMRRHIDFNIKHQTKDLKEYMDKTMTKQINEKLMGFTQQLDDKITDIENKLKMKSNRAFSMELI